MKQQKPFHHGNLRRVLFDVALKLLDENGAEGVTIRAVAKAAGVSHSAPVNHYKDRRALLTALAKAQFETLLSEIESNLAKQVDEPSAGFKVIGTAIMEFGFKYPNRYQLLWRADLVDHKDTELLMVMDQIYDQLCAEFSRATPGSHFDKDTYAVALWSMVHGYVDMRLSGMFEPLNDKISGAPRGQAIINLFGTLMSKP